MLRNPLVQSPLKLYSNRYRDARGVVGQEGNAQDEGQNSRSIKKKG